MELIDSSTPGKYTYKMDDGTMVLASVRRLPSKPGHLGLAVKICELTAAGNPRRVGGEIVWTPEHTSSLKLRGLLDNKDSSVKEQIQEIVAGVVARRVDELEVTKLTMAAIAEIPCDVSDE